MRITFHEVVSGAFEVRVCSCTLDCAHTIFVIVRVEILVCLNFHKVKKVWQINFTNDRNW